MYAPRSTFLTHHKIVFAPDSVDKGRTYSAVNDEHKKRIAKELKLAGLTKWGQLYSECRYIPIIIHPEDEHIEGIVYGRNYEGRAMLIATNRRVIFLDKKPWFIKSDEMTYDIIGGVSYGQAGFMSTVTLHTRIGDYTLRTYNLKSAAKFRDYIELRCLEQEEGNYDYAQRKRSLQVN